MKKILKFFFDVDDNIKTYKFPVIKIVSSLIIGYLSLRIISIKNYTGIDALNDILAYLFMFVEFAVLYGVIRCVACSLIEIGTVRKLRNKVEINIDEIMKYSIKMSMEEILKLSEENDIMEFEIIYCGKLIGIGASSDCDNTSFFDKKYYIDKQEYDTIKEFEQALFPYSFDGELVVATIDEGKANEWK